MFANTPWAITPERLIEIRGALTPGVARPSSPNGQVAQSTSDDSFTVYSGTALIPITGIIGKNITPIMRMFGGTSTVKISRQLTVALADASVKQILLYIDSPGGMVDGTQALSETILAARGKKPIVALADGMMCSAAYWIGSSADQIYAASGTAQVGSIGVVASHVDVSGLESKIGVKTTEITAGKFKRIASNYEPLNADGRSSIQDTVDYLYSLFVTHVAAARGADQNVVLNRMADGRVFIGQQAVTAGLIDGIRSFDEIVKGKVSAPIRQSNSPVAKGAGIERSPTPAAMTSQFTSTKGDRIMINSSQPPVHEKSDRNFLYQKAKTYQAEHPGISMMEALETVSKESFVPPGCAANPERLELHKKVKAYQAKHPEVSYDDALKSIAWLDLGGKK